MLFRRNFLPAIVTTICLVALAGNLFGVAAQAVKTADSNDIFAVTTPGAEAQVRGEATISWIGYDDDRNIVPYEISLRKGNRCQDLVGLVAAGNAPSVNSLQSINWQSAAPLQSIVNVADGKYCLEVCVSLRNLGNNYSACNGRWINIGNQNTAPTFLTNPPADHIVYTDEGWSYPAHAADKEKDAFTVSLLEKPDFAAVDIETGMVITDVSAKTPGKHKFVLEVRDALGASSQQEWELTILSREVTSSTTTTGQVNGTSTSQSANADPVPTDKIKLDAPAANSNFLGESNRVAWSVSEFAGFKVERFILGYIAQDSGESHLLAELPENTRSFIWDVRNLANAKYAIVLQARTTDGQILEARSALFNIDNPAAGEVVSRPLIVNLSPAEGSETENLRPVLSGEFARPQGGQIDPDSFVFEVDGINRRDWCERVGEADFSCQSPQDMEPGLHRARVGIQSKDKQLAVREWTFVLKAPPASAGDQAASILAGVNWQLLIFLCLFVLILVLLPWGVYLLWRRREQRIGTSEVVYQTGNNEYDVYYTPQPANENIFVIPEPNLPDLSGNYAETKSQPEQKVTVNVKEEPNSQPAVKPAEKPAPKPADKPKEVYIDPTQYSTYEDYLKAVNSTTNTKVEVKEQKPAEAKPSAPEPKPTVVTETKSESKPQTPTVVVVTPTKQEPVMGEVVTFKPTQPQPAQQALPPADKTNFIGAPDYMSDLKESEYKTAPKVTEKKASESNPDAPDWLNPV